MLLVDFLLNKYQFRWKNTILLFIWILLNYQLNQLNYPTSCDIHSHKTYVQLVLITPFFHEIIINPNLMISTKWPLKRKVRNMKFNHNNMIPKYILSVRHKNEKKEQKKWTFFLDIIFFCRCVVSVTTHKHMPSSHQ